MEKEIKTNRHRLFSKALFKQSCKANGIMWVIITAAVCFMLACVMLISGTSNISSVKDGVQTTIIEEIIKSEVKKATVKLYDGAIEGESKFDVEFANKFNELNTQENYAKFMKPQADAKANGEALVTAKVQELLVPAVTEEITNEITARVQSEAEEIRNEVATAVATDMASEEARNKIAAKVAAGEDVTTATNDVMNEYIASETENIKAVHIEKATQEINTPEHQQEVGARFFSENKDSYTNQAIEALKDELAEITLKATKDSEDKFKEIYVVPAYTYAVNQVGILFDKNADETKSLYSISMVTINPNGAVSEQYTKNNEAVPAEYIEDFTSYMLADVNSYESSTTPTKTLSEYIKTTDRTNIKVSRAYNATSIIIASTMVGEEYKQKIVDQLADYKVSRETYDQMGFDYKKVKDISYEGMLEYQDKFNYQLNNLPEDIKNDSVKYKESYDKIHEDLKLEVAGSLLDRLPQNVSDGISELGTMDLYGLIVGSIFFKMAGLLLPIIYVIMVSNNLVASQVDTGSMAYVLSTSTRREEVTWTQSVFLIGSLFLMFVCTTITSCICFRIANVTTDLNYGKLVLINLGAFLTLFAISGINFFTSCYFDRSKKAMALGGGFSMFFLVATMLGLFGSPVIPSVVRISALNNFNYVSIISLFDVVSILKGEYMWIWKVAILVLIGLVGYITGAIKFKKKDLPL